MVALKVSDQHGVEVEDEVSAPRTGGQMVTLLEVKILWDDEASFHALAMEGFAEDWESDADSIYDNFLEDAGLQ